MRRACGTLHLLSAAQLHGWKVRLPPDKPQLAVRPGRKVPPELAASYTITRRDLPRGQWITDRHRTVLDCARLPPFDDALCVADSALRSGDPDALFDAIHHMPRLRRRRIERVLDAATPAAANPFESALRAICLTVPGLGVRPQVSIHGARGFIARVDLADTRLKIVIEADSHEFHHTRDQLDTDCHRHAELAAQGWLVVRFTWVQVIFRAQWVRETLTRLVLARGIQAGAA